MYSLCYYRLDAENNPVPEPDYLAWGEWFHGIDPQVALTEAEDKSWTVLTVFLGINHQTGLQTKPILWETLISGGPLDGYYWLYVSLAEAVKGHENAVASCESCGIR